jgi:hypothetical protein
MDREIPRDQWIGFSPNSYAIVIRIPEANFYDFYHAGRNHHFEFPEGVIRPEQKDTENVIGCGILMNSDDKLTIFFQCTPFPRREFPVANSPSRIPRRDISPSGEFPVGTFPRRLCSCILFLFNKKRTPVMSLILFFRPPFSFFVPPISFRQVSKLNFVVTSATSRA